MLAQAARRRPQDRLLVRDASAALTMIYALGAKEETFPREAPASTEFEVHLPTAAELSGLAVDRFQEVVDRVLVPAEICLKVVGKRNRFRFNKTFFEVNRTAEDLNWSEILSAIGPEPGVLQVFWVLVATLNSPPDELQHIRQNEIADLAHCSRWLVVEKLAHLESVGLLQSEAVRSRHGKRYALTPRALGGRIPRLPASEVVSEPQTAFDLGPEANPVTPPTRAAAPSVGHRVVIGGEEIEVPPGTVIETATGLRIQIPD